MGYVTLTVGLLLPWIAGSLWIAVLWPGAAPGRLPAIVGYGHLLGLLGLTLLMRAASLLGGRFGWVEIGVPLALAAAAAAVALWRRRRRRNRLQPPLPETDAPSAVPAAQADTGQWRYLPASQRVLALVLLALLAHRLVALGLEVWLRPIYPWDAFVQWTTKARVWFELGHMAPFLPTSEWLVAGPGTFTDAAPGYPGTVPLLQTWTAVALGRWDPALVNLAWPLCAIALGAGLFGQLRVAGLPWLWSLAGTYALLSLPFLGAHVALGGYADLHVAAVFGLAGCAFANWAAGRAAGAALPAARRSLAVNGIMAALLALSLPLWKNPGPVWLASFVPAFVVALNPRAGRRLAVLLAVLGVLVVIWLAVASPVILNYRLHLDFTWVGGALARSMLALGNWHLLWWVVPVALLFARRHLLSPQTMPATVLLATCAGVLVVVFFFSNAAIWVTDYSTVNRALLHVVAFVVFFTTVAVYRWWEAAAGVGSAP